MINLQRSGGPAIRLQQSGAGAAVQLRTAGGASIKLAPVDGGAPMLFKLAPVGASVKVQNTGFKVNLQPVPASQLIRVKIGLAQAGPRGPAGPAGPVGGTVVTGTTDLIYTLGKLTRVNLPDGTHKLLTYTGSVLNRVDHVKTGQTVRKDMVYASGRLDAVETSIF